MAGSEKDRTKKWRFDRFFKNAPAKAECKNRAPFFALNLLNFTTESTPKLPQKGRLPGAGSLRSDLSASVGTPYARKHTETHGDTQIPIACQPELEPAQSAKFLALSS